MAYGHLAAKIVHVVHASKVRLQCFHFEQVGKTSFSCWLVILFYSTSRFTDSRFRLYNLEMLDNVALHTYVIHNAISAARYLIMNVEAFAKA